MPRFLANGFLGFNSVFNVQVWYICLKLIDLSKKSTFCLFKTEFKAKKLLSRNLGRTFRRGVHIKPDLLITQNKMTDFVRFTKIYLYKLFYSSKLAKLGF